MNEPHKSFFQTFTGVLAAITSLIIAVTGLYAVTGGFNLSTTSSPTENPQIRTSEQTHQQQLQALKRQKEIDDLRLSQEKQKLIAEQELAALRAKNNQLSSGLVNPQKHFSNTTIPSDSVQYNVASNLTGRWSYTNSVGTYIFVLEQNGNNIHLQEFDSYGNNVGNGTGYIEGSDVSLSWVEPYLFVMTLEVEAELQINAQANMLVGNMYAQGNIVQVALYRQ